MARPRGTKPDWQLGMSSFVLVLALSYCALQVANCDPISSQSSARKGVKDLAHLNIRTPEGAKMLEDAEYDEGKEVMTLHGLDGSFLVHDFEKGLRIIKDANTDVCYVTPVETNKAVSVKVENFLKDYDGLEIHTNEYREYRAIILPGTIEDTSFLPTEAEKECKKARWLTILGEVSAMEGCKLDGQTGIGGDVVTVSDLTIPLDKSLAHQYRRQVEASISLGIGSGVSVSVGLTIRL